VSLRTVLQSCVMTCSALLQCVVAANHGGASQSESHIAHRPSRGARSCVAARCCIVLLQCIAVCCRVLQYVVAVCCSVLQCVLQYSATSLTGYDLELQCVVAVRCCSALLQSGIALRHYVAVRCCSAFCSILQLP